MSDKENSVTFEQILFDVLLGIDKCVEIEFWDSKERAKYFLKLQDEKYDNQMTIFVSTLSSILMYTDPSKSWYAEKRYTQVDDNRFKKLW